MMRALRALTLALATFLSACAATTTPQQAALTGCTAYASMLESLAVQRRAGLLSDEMIERVDHARSIATPICTAETPPAGAQATIDKVLAQLEAILAEAAAREK